MILVQEILIWFEDQILVQEILIWFEDQILVQEILIWFEDQILVQEMLIWFEDQILVHEMFVWFMYQILVREQFSSPQDVDLIQEPDSGSRFAHVNIYLSSTKSWELYKQVEYFIMTIWFTVSVEILFS